MTRIYALIYEVLSRDNVQTPANRIIHEQHARTVGELSLPILECFYPEVLAYDEKDITEALAIRRKASRTASTTTTTNNMPKTLPTLLSERSTTPIRTREPEPTTLSPHAPFTSPAQLHGSIFKPLNYEEIDRVIKTRSLLVKQVSKLVGTDEKGKKIIESIKAENFNLALRLACADGALKIVEQLIEKNERGKLELNFNSTSSNGNTPHDWATLSGNRALVDLLERNGAKTGVGSHKKGCAGPKKT